MSILLSSSSPITQTNKSPNFPKPKSTKTYFSSALKTQPLSLSLSTTLFTYLQFQFPLTSCASQLPAKIDLESALVSIDDFFNQYPFFVSGCAFIWLLVVPATQEYLRKYKFISAIDAFKKLKDDPNSQLLDIRDSKTLRVLASPNLKYLNKNALQIEFRTADDDHQGFVKRVKDSIKDPANTTLCILDILSTRICRFSPHNYVESRCPAFDGESMKVAELLFNNGFKEAYAIRGGVRGNNGWLEIQETLLPPSVHINLKRKVKRSNKGKNNGAIEVQQTEVKSEPHSVTEVKQTDNGYVNKSKEPNTRSSSPYPMYPGLKPPSSPTPSKPQ
ncbi:rhodanese-like domain-containing protein 4A, chloroplastic [Bidens hawaiensis]|uniref:rhodanese-like domain-containing protein 4A, chloroplastic n=1 Tax=Bidens hawaiensis TaxID=980011 RepID=UPI00404A471E